MEEQYSMRVVKGVIYLFVSYCLSGCDSYISLNLTKMVDRKHFVAGEVFYIDENLLQNIEKRKYANLIAKNLIKNGYKVSSKKSKANYLLKFSYNIDDGKTYYKDKLHYNDYIGIYSEQEAYVAYTRILKISIYDKKTSKQIFKVNIRNKGTVKNFSNVAKCLIQTALKDFPGQSGYKELEVKDNCEEQ